MPKRIACLGSTEQVIVVNGPRATKQQTYLLAKRGDRKPIIDSKPICGVTYRITFLGVSFEEFNEIAQAYVHRLQPNIY